MPVPRDFNHVAQPGRRRLLAVWRMRRGVECVAARVRETCGALMAVNVAVLARDLQELIAALDRRLPSVVQAGEAEIARDAAALRAKAVDRLAALTKAIPAPVRR